jgi:hypothetical protein
LGRIFEEEDELALSCPTLDKTAKDRSPQPNLNDGYSILASERLPEEEEEDDENRETAFKSATSTSFSPTVDPPANNIGDDDSQETVAYHADDSDSQDTASYNADNDSQETVPYNVDSDSQDTVPYNVDSDSQDTIPYNVNDATLDDLEVHERSEEAHDPLDDLQAHDFSSDDLQVPLLVDINYTTRPSDSESNALPRDDDQHGSFSVSSIPFIEQVPFVTSPARMSSQSSRRISDPNVSLLPRILSPSSHHLDNNPNGSLLPRISSYQPPANEPLPSNLYNNNTLEEEQDELDDPFDDITEEDMLELVRMETTVTSQSSTSSKKRASSPIPNLSSSLQKKQLKSSLGTPIDNYFFHSSSSLNSTKDLGKFITIIHCE